MNKHLTKKRLGIVCATIIVLILGINGCKKDTHTATQQTAHPTDPAVLAAKQWYQGVYPRTSSALATHSIIDSMNLSLHIQPDWDKAETYTRFDDEVVELPLDAETSEKFALGLNSDAGVGYNATNSRRLE